MELIFDITAVSLKYSWLPYGSLKLITPAKAYLSKLKILTDEKYD